MSRPRQVRQAQRQAPKRHPEMFDQIIDALDRQDEQEDDEFFAGPWPMPEKNQQKEKQS